MTFFVDFIYNDVMKEKIFYYSGDLSLNQEILIDGEEFHHLSNVMRARIADKVILFNGNGNFYHGEIIDIQKKYAKINIVSCEKSQNEPSIELVVYQALAKGDKLSLIMQKITEIGASELAVFDSEFCDVKANSSRVDRLENISISAAKQCKRASLVKQSGVYDINDITQHISTFDEFYVAYENEEGLTLAGELLKNKDKIKKVAIMIGAEGGFSQKEIDLLKNAGAKIVSLGSRILRTETASIVCSGLIMQMLETI